jgi:hypothetical protein
MMTDKEKETRDRLIMDMHESTLKRFMKAGLTPAEVMMILAGMIVSMAGGAVQNERGR